MDRERKIKKLKLSKETMKNLDSDKLQEIYGGACVTSPYRSCLTRDIDC